MKLGDVVHWPCLAGLHWLSFKIQRFDWGSGEAVAQHDCRGIEMNETRRFTQNQVDDAFTPDLPLPAFRYCLNCTAPLFQGRNVGRSFYVECCAQAFFLCKRCENLSWEHDVKGTRSWEDWMRVVHAPVCGHRCGDCKTPVASTMAWKCFGCGMAERQSCGPTRCDPCFAKHKLTCTHPTWRSADHRCPECEHSALEVVDGASGKIRRCTWCKAEWQAYYPGDPRSAAPMGEAAL